MCWCKGDNKDKNCKIVAGISIVFHLTLLCIGITTLIFDMEKKPRLDSSSAGNSTHRNELGHPQDYIQLVKITAIFTFAVIGEIMTVLLIIGIKNKHSCFVLTFFCYVFLASILLALSGILLFIKCYWRRALLLNVLSVIGFRMSAIVYRTYEDFITQESSLNQHNSISTVSLLTEDFNDLTDDLDPNLPTYTEATFARNDPTKVTNTRNYATVP